MIEKTGFDAVERPMRSMPMMAPKKAKGMAKIMIRGWK